YYHAAQANAKPRRCSSRGYQLLNPAAHPGKHFRTLFGNRDGMLEMGAGLAVDGYHRPAIFQCLRVQRSHIHHRLEGKHISFFDFWTLARFAVIRNLWILMHPPANAMPDVVTNNRISLGLSVRLDSETNITEMIAHSTLCDRQFQALFSNAHQLQTILAYIADGDGGCRITHESVEGHPHID